MHRTFASLLAASLLRLASSVQTETINIPSEVFLTPVDAEFVTTPGSVLDGQKLSPGANATAYDWWYFDAVSTSSANQSLTIVFFENAGGFVQTNPTGGPIYVAVTGTYEDGTPFEYLLNAPGGLSINESDRRISGDWVGSGASFSGVFHSGDRATGSGCKLETAVADYVVTLDAPELGVVGKFTLKGRTPAHYPCDLNTGAGNITELVIPTVGWANAQPDADAEVSLTINGTDFTFTGVGYHDKNWALQEFATSVQSWYWGHARLGPYSIVWFDTRTAGDNLEYFSSFVAKDGKVISARCGADSVLVRPAGANDDYPPVLTSGAPEITTLKFTLDDGSVLAANVTLDLVVLSNPIYFRMIGSVIGGIEGEEVFTGGRSLFEEFKFPIV